MKYKLTCLITATLCVSLCLSGCTNTKTKKGGTSSADKSGAAETVSQIEGINSEIEDASVAGASSLTGGEKQETDLPSVTREQASSQANNSQSQPSQSSESAYQSQQTTQAADDGQSAAPSDLYEGGGY